MHLLLSWSFCWCGHGNKAPKILRTLNFQQVCCKTALFICYCSSYQLKHTSSQIEDAKKYICSCMETGRFIATSWFLLTSASTATSSHILVLSSHFFNQLCSLSISNTQMRKKNKTCIFSPVFRVWKLWNHFGTWQITHPLRNGCWSPQVSDTEIFV